MSEDGGWFAFRKGEATRGEVMAAVARGAQDDAGWCWLETFEAYSVRVGWVTESEERGWWSQCDYDTPGAIPAWIVRRRR